jgi:hypothetical protein
MTSRSRSRIVAATFALGLVAAACSSSSGNSGSNAAAPSNSTPATVDASAPGVPGSDGTPTDTSTDGGDSTAVVPQALQFTAPLVGGGEFTGADYADKPTVFWFWAPT